MMNWSYVAGFFDGEGSVSKSFHRYELYRIQITQAHEGVLRKIRDFTGVGSVRKLRKRQAHWKDSWVYQVSNRRDVLFFLKSVYSHLIVKKGIAFRYIPILEKEVLRVRKKDRDLRELIQKSKFLRKQGLSYRAIGEKLGVDHGYARRIILFK